MVSALRPTDDVTPAEFSNVPGTRCSISTCANNSSKTKGKGISYFRFPKDTDLCNKWIEAAQREGSFNIETSRVCSIHFTDECYIRDLQNELLGIPSRKILKEDALPSLKLDEMDNLTDPDDIFLRQHTDCESQTSDDDSQGSSVSLRKYNALQLEHSDLKREFAAHKKESAKRINLLSKLLRYHKGKRINAQNEVQRILQGVFSRNEINIITKKKKRVNWTEKEISKALTLRYLSRSSYVYLRKKLFYPLPALSTLREHASKMCIQEGVIHDSLEFMRICGENKSPLEKVCVLSFDEMKIKSLFEYDKGQDQIISPRKQVEVAMVRGLFSSWKQPIYMHFDQRMTKTILYQILCDLHKIKYKVVAMVSDCGGGNMGLWKELDISLAQTYFKHPATSENVYVFADAPYLLILVRNWLLDTGFVLNHGRPESAVIDKRPLECLVHKTDQDTKCRINEKHVTCVKTQRQNVRLAAELLSHTTAAALRHYLPHEDHELCNNLADFIDAINSWFDVFNSYQEDHVLLKKRAYGKHLVEQQQILMDIIDIMEKIVPVGRKAMQTFQKGIIISTKSLMALFDSMRHEHNVTIIQTHALNQDCLENLFYQIRNKDPDEDPTVLGCFNRLKSISLGENPDVAPTKTTHVEFVSKAVINQMGLDLNIKQEPHDDSDHSSAHGSYAQFNENFPETGDDSLEFIAGYLAHKYHTHNLTDNDASNEHKHSLPSWMRHLPYKNFVTPSGEWLSSVKVMNFTFHSYHGDELDFKSDTNIVKKLSRIIKERLKDVPNELIEAFIKLRTKIRINYLNARLNSNKRTSGSEDEAHNKTSKVE